jgi:hypothetical protein
LRSPLARLEAASPTDQLGGAMSASGRKRKFSPRAHVVRFTPESGQHQSGQALRSALCNVWTAPSWQGLRIVGALTAPTSVALACWWRGRQQHQKPNPQPHLSYDYSCERELEIQMNAHSPEKGQGTKLDQASWHRAKELDVPTNMSLLPLPPRALDSTAKKLGRANRATMRTLARARRLDDIRAIQHRPHRTYSHSDSGE